MQDGQPPIDREREEQRYTHFFEEAPTMLVITREADGVAYIEDCNPLFQKTLGYAREELIGRPLADFYCPDSRKALAEGGYRQALDSGIVDVERNLVRRDGSLVPTILRASPITDANGAVCGTHAAYIDIRAYKEAEAALRHSEERLRQALDAARMGIWEWDMRTGVVSWSEQVGALFGLAPGEFAGTYEAYQELIHPDDRGLVKSEIERALQSGDYKIVHRLIWPDGSLHWLEGKGRVVLDEASQPIRMYGTVMDITERRMAEEELRRSREQLSTTLENAPAFILTLDRSGRILSANRLPEPLTADKVIGQPIDVLGSPPNVDRPRAAFEEALATGRPVRYEASTHIVGGEERWFEVRMGPVVVDGDVAKVIFIATDITERIHTEETLRRFRVALDSSADGIFLVDPVSMQIVDVNDTACVVLGYTREEMLRITAQELLPDVRQEELEQQFKRLIDNEEAFGAMIIDVRMKSGRTLPVEVYLRALATQDGYIIVASGRNIRDRKVAEAALQQERALLAQRVEQRTAELRAANAELAQQTQEVHRNEDALRIANAELARALRLKDEFLANMSHELRTPLNAILNLSESLVEEIAGPLSDRQQTFCNMILESGQHLLSLINDILDLSKIESGHADLEIVPVAVEPVCQSSMRMVAEQAKKKRLTSSIHIDAGAQWVHADARRLKQMLVNLLGNAVKFTPRGGRIGIDVSVDAEAGRISFAVWDTGIGIAPEDMSRLFQPFVQLDAGLARQYGGSGLGLVLVSRMARIHGGGVRVESTQGEGSRFTVDLAWSANRSGPYSELEEHAEQTLQPSLAYAARAQPDLHGVEPPLILLVDDTDAVIAPVASYLEAHHYRVVTAYNGESAIRIARELRPDLILMDIQMPDIDGLEAARWIRNEPGLESTPIVALTALTMPGDRERCLASGMDDYLAKPVRLRRLAQCIETNLVHKSA